MLETKVKALWDKCEGGSLADMSHWTADQAESDHEILDYPDGNISAGFSGRGSARRLKNTIRKTEALIIEHMAEALTSSSPYLRRYAKILENG